MKRPSERTALIVIVAVAVILFVGFYFNLIPVSQKTNITSKADAQVVLKNVSESVEDVSSILDDIDSSLS